MAADILSIGLPQNQFVAERGYELINQGNYPRRLYVDGTGLVRSATAMVLAHKAGFNARSVGVDFNNTLQPFTMQLIHWADWVVFMDQKSYDTAQTLLEPYKGAKEALALKSVVVNVPQDNYYYMQHELQLLIKEQLPELAIAQ